VRSSPAFAASSLELPPLTAAERTARVVLALAVVFVAWACARQGQSAMAALASVGGGLLAVGQTVVRLRTRRGQVRRLEARADGSIWLHGFGRAACPMAAGPGTRLLGPSVFLDLRPVLPGSTARLRLWITPLDVPRDALRRLGIVLAGRGLESGS